MKGYIISTNFGVGNNAGSKAKNDIESILVANGLQKIQVQIPDNKIKKLLMSNSVWKRHLKFIDEGFICFQYPLYSKVITKSFVKFVRDKPGIKTVAIIHDIESLRLRSKENAAVANEVAILNGFDCLIVHNTAMRTWLKDNGLTTNCVLLGAFDYQSSVVAKNTEKNRNKVNFAGNLAKSSFLQSIHSSKVQYCVFGPNPGKYSKSIHYEGSFLPEDLIAKLDSGFGLVWDGSSVETCDGVFGEYLKYNNPHKVSLYVRSGLPVLIWEKAAMSEWVVENHLGIAVSSLNEVDDIVSNMDKEKYLGYVNSCLKVSDQMQKGFYIKQAIHSAMSMLDVEVKNYHER